MRENMLGATSQGEAFGRLQVGEWHNLICAVGTSCRQLCRVNFSGGAGLGRSSRAPLETRLWRAPDWQQRGQEKGMDLRWILLMDRMWIVKKREDSNVCLQQLCGDWRHLLRWGSLRGGGSRAGEEMSSPTSQHVALQPLLNPVQAKEARRSTLWMSPKAKSPSTC